jgi:hypothetical protein
MKTIVAIMLALAMALATNSFAVATWENFGADPAYKSREAAIADAPRVLRQAGYPEQAISLLSEAMKGPGVRTHVTNGMKLDFMRSGKSALWRNVLVKFKKPPRETSMEYSAPSEEWTVEWDGKKWTVGIPDVCNNIYGKRPVRHVPVATPAPRTVTTTRGCPNGIILYANIWSREAIASVSEDLAAGADALITIASKRDSKNASIREAYSVDDVSRTLGDEIIAKVGVRAPVDSSITAQVIDPTSLRVVEDLGSFKFVEGIAAIPLTPDQRKMIIQTIWPAWVVSPTKSGGKARLWLLPEEWMNGRGNGRFCSKQENGIFKEADFRRYNAVLRATQRR